MATYSFHRRVTATHPGKHGEKDIRAEFNGNYPTASETLALVWLHFKAEDRYDEHWQDGRARFKRWIDEVYQAQTRLDALGVIKRCEDDR